NDGPILRHGPTSRFDRNIGLSASRRDAHDDITLSQFGDGVFLPSIRDKGLRWRHPQSIQPGGEGDGRLMEILLNRFVHGATLRCRGLWFPRGRDMRRGWRGVSLLLADQDHQVGLKSCTVLGGMAQQDFDQAAFACAEMSLNTPTRQAVQERDRLLSQELFEFFGGHSWKG